MPRDLFGTITDPPAHIGTRSRLTLPLSLAAHAAALAVLIVVPLVATDVLPLPDDFTARSAHPAGPAAGASTPHSAGRHDGGGATTESQRRADRRALEHHTGGRRCARQPISATSPPARRSRSPSSARAATTGCPASPRLLPPAPRAPVRVGGAVTAPDEDSRRRARVPAEWPATRRFRASSSSRRRSAWMAAWWTQRCCGRCRSSDQAALDAVRQWRFTPPQLNGEPIAVIMTVTVNFRLD